MDKMNVELVAMAKSAASAAGLSPTLVCAIVEQESSWEPGAYRYEPAFFKNYVVGQYAAGKIDITEAQARAFSWGLMQLMGQCAREDGFTGKFFTDLCDDPATGLEWGCKHFKHKLLISNNDVSHALLIWNGGKDKTYPAEVLARIAHYL